jgi:hypothetical protein
MPTVLGAEEKLNKAGPTEKSIPNLSKQAAKLRADLEDAKIAATRFTKRAQHAAEGMLEDVAHGIKHYPLRALGVAFGLGATMGMILVGSLKTRKS